MPSTPPEAPRQALGIDFGTSAVRALVLDHGGERARTRTALAAAGGADGRREQDPQTWWQALGAALAALDPEVRADVGAIAVAGTSATVLAIDDTGHPLGPALMYDDRRAVAEAATIARRAPADSAARGPSSSLAKALWLARALGREVRVVHQADWITGRLLGDFGYSDENNALKLGYDPVHRRWPAWVQEQCAGQVRLPRVRPPGTTLGRIDPDAARALGLPRGVRIRAGTTDSTAAVIATGARRPGQGVTALGSTLVLKVLGPRPLADAAHGVYSHRLGGSWLTGGASNSGGAVLARFFTPGEIARYSAAIDPEQDSGLDYYPLLRPGERFPVADPAFGGRLSPRPADPVRFLHGLLEGIARIEARGYALLAELGAPALTGVLTIGGGARNPTWQRIRQRLLGVPVRPAACEEPAAGAALLALRGPPD